jgi:hypothetical protein
MQSNSKSDKEVHMFRWSSTWYYHEYSKQAKLKDKIRYAWRILIFLIVGV